MSAPNPEVGEKVLLNDGRSAIVRFRGPTSFAPGDWIGVELDESSGKNDGSVQGERYFDCPDKHGMFLRSTGIKQILEAPKRNSRASLANGPAAKGRVSNVGAAGKVKPSTVNGRSRESFAASPTPARGPAGRVSSLRSDEAVECCYKLDYIANEHPAHIAGRIRGIEDEDQSGTFRSYKWPTNYLGTTFDYHDDTDWCVGRAQNSQRLSTQSQTSTATSASEVDTEGKDNQDDNEPRVPVSRPDSTSQLDGRDEADSVASSVPENDVDATPKAVRPALSRDLPPSRTPSTQSISPTTSAASIRPAGARGAANPTREIEDLQTKLRVLEKRRLEDREKLKALERIQQERDRFESIIQKLQQKYQPQQQLISDLKSQIKEYETLAANIESMQGDHEAELENATLDREMAEEQLETVRTELAALRERHEEMELEIEVLREENQELGKEMNPEERTSQGWLQLERSNERYREALIRLRDVTQEQEAELRSQVAQLEKDLQHFSGINEEAANLKAKLLESEAAIDDLKQQLEAAQGGEEMLEELSDRNLALQERIEDLSAAIEDLENLKELNDELEVNHVEAEKQMQEEIDFKDSVISEQLRRSDEQLKRIEDYELTVARFREAFRTLQADLEDMRASKQITDTEAEDLNSKSKALMDLNMKLRSSAARTQVKAIDLELQRLEAEEAARHLAIVRLFLPESYQADRDSVLALLRFNRIAFKADLLRRTIKDQINDYSTDEALSGCAALDRLAWMQEMSQCFISTINACSANDFSKFEKALYELEPVERGLSSHIDALRNEDLQMKKMEQGLERSVAVMSHLASTLLPDPPPLAIDEMLMQASLLQNHLEHSALAFSLCKQFVEKHSTANPLANGTCSDDGEEGTGDSATTDAQPSFQAFYERIDALISSARSAKVLASKSHRELLDLQSRHLSPGSSNLVDFANAATIASTIATFGRTAGQAIVSLVPDSPTILTPRVVAPALTKAANEIFSPAIPETSMLSTLHDRLSTLADQLQSLHAVATDISGTSEFDLSPPPWIQRADTLRETASASSQATHEIARLNEMLAERSLLVRSKEKELDEQGVRIEMLEARMREAREKAGKVDELESKVAGWEKERSRWRAEVKRLKEEMDKEKAERERAVKEAESRRARAGDEEGEVLGRRARVELERRRVQVQGLRGVVRHLAETGRKGRGDDMEWLERPLVGPRSEEVVRLSRLERETKDVMRSLVDLTLSAGVIDLGRKDGRGRLGWRPARETSGWIVQKRREDYETWKGWKDSVLERASSLTGTSRAV